MEADEGQANVVEYAVRMRRIPEDVLMKSVFDKGALRDDHLKEIAAVLAGFHNGAQRSAKIDEFGAPRAFRINTDENFEQTKKYIGITIDKADFESLSEWTAAFYVTKGELFQARIAMPANIVEGDYKAEFFLVRDRTVISTAETEIVVQKAGIERWIFNLSQQRPLAYGIMSVLVALLAGWLAAAAFRLIKR